MARAIDSEAAYQFLTDQLVKETGAFSRGVNKGLNIARSAMRNPDAMPTLTPPNEPLSIEQLREMDGEPVWIANPDALEYGRWGIVDGVYQADDDQVLMLRGDYSCHYYGKTWLAYRRPPEGEKDR